MKILKGEFSKGDHIIVDIEDRQLVFRKGAVSAAKK
jgi:hypothetical protein